MIREFLKRKVFLLPQVLVSREGREIDLEGGSREKRTRAGKPEKSRSKRDLPSRASGKNPFGPGGFRSPGCKPGPSPLPTPTRLRR